MWQKYYEKLFDVSIRHRTIQPTETLILHILNKWQIEFHIFSLEWLVIDIQWPATTTTFGSKQTGPDFPARKLPNQRLQQLARRWKKSHFASIKLIRDRIIVAFISCSHTFQPVDGLCLLFLFEHNIFNHRKWWRRESAYSSSSISGKNRKFSIPIRSANTTLTPAVPACRPHSTRQGSSSFTHRIESSNLFNLHLCSCIDFAIFLLFFWAVVCAHFAMRFSHEFQHNTEKKSLTFFFLLSRTLALVRLTFVVTLPGVMMNRWTDNNEFSFDFLSLHQLLLSNDFHINYSDVWREWREMGVMKGEKQCENRK